MVIESKIIEKRIYMKFEVFQGIIIPFVGTFLGSCCVFAMKGEISSKIRAMLTGFAGGVMIAASIWSLIIPAIEGSSSLGVLSFLPAVVGFMLGILSLITLDKALPC